ncbi:protoheme IX farnesyltransferase [Bdellovibrio bacteriovorus]|uniref:Protoheme IX farnesyltransferase n=1 Tax=Bdellovibrio bacteriovorus TaxID=959 RepID=A0A150WRL1_BDEBC|nr:heme o synthase [Bdellovibrio bacteriovorus]KYG66964.1 protoheme IX farnesyltransferase [Bdellovibrio bacteriovorus]
MLKTYADLTKFGIVVFSVLTGLVGYATGFQIEHTFDWILFFKVIAGIYCISSGSLALNQVQEWKLDQKMPRTAKRPIASGKIKPAAAGIMALVLIFVGSQLLFEVQPVAGWVGLFCIFLYNVAYTMWWKRRWVFAAVPGAIPGALPVTIGYAAANPDIFNAESLYLFLIMFLWQMPHFWVLAIKYKDDYAKGGIPTLPVALGMDRSLFQIGLYTFAYVGVALAAPLFVHASWMFVLLTFPFAFKLLQEFYRYYKSNGTERWLAFFMWLNVSMLVFLVIPVIDKWNFLFISSN